MNARVVKTFIIFCLCLFFQPAYIQGLVVGSDTAISKEMFVAFPSADVDNTIKGFAWMCDGFALEDSLTTCTFGSTFATCGPLYLNRGTLWLTHDLVLHNMTTFTSLGNLKANTIQLLLLDHALSAFGDTADDALHTFENMSLLLTNAVTLQSAIQFSGTGIINGAGNSLDLSSTGSIVIAPNSRLTLKNVRLEHVTQNNFVLSDDSSELVLDDMHLEFGDHYTFNTGSILFKHKVELSGTYSFIYESAYTSTIDSLSKLIVNNDLQFCIGKHAQTLADPLYFVDTSSELKLSNCSFVVTGSGLQFKKGKVVVDNEVLVDVLGTTTQTGVVIGDGTSENDTTIIILPGSALYHKSGYIVYNNAANDKFKASSKSSLFVRDLNSKVYVPHDFHIHDMTVELTSQLIAPIEIASGKQLCFERSITKLPGIEFELNAHQAQPYVYILDGNDYIFLTKGILPAYLSVSGSGNELLGNGGITGSIILSGALTVFTCKLNGFIDNVVLLNGGTFVINRDLSLYDNGKFVGTGTVHVGTSDISYSNASRIENSAIVWQGTGGGIALQGDMSLLSTWTIKGKVVINGKGNEFALGGGAALVIDDDSELVLKNLRIIGVSGDNIRCSNDGGVLSLVNTELVRSGDVYFEHGSIKFCQENSLSGAYTFSYDSCMTSTIESGARWAIDEGSVSLGRNVGAEPLYFGDSSSVCQCSNMKFYVKEPGMTLTRGTFFISKDVEVDIASTSTANGLVFGDGTQVNDPSIILNAGATIRFPSGHVLYDITTPHGIRSRSKTVQLIRDASSVFHLNQSLTMSNITLDSNALSQLTIAAGKTFDYVDARLAIGQAQFDVTGDRYNAVTTLLSGNDVLVLLEGLLPMVTLVQGVGNIIEGNGGIQGPIIVQGGSEVTLAINGMVFSSPTLNEGTIKLGNDLYLASGVVFVGNGTINLSDDSLYFGSKPLSWSSNTKWLGSGGALNLSSHITLLGTWTFSGNCVLQGYGHAIDLGQTGNIAVDSNSTLLCQNIAFENVAARNIRCFDDSGTIILDDVIWKQVSDDSFQFSSGALRCKNKVSMTGVHSTFAYQSMTTSTICDRSQLKLDTNFTFSYDAYAPDRLVLESEQSKLVLNSATLCATATGMKLTGGVCEIKGESTLSSELSYLPKDTGGTRIVEQGITFGDGTSAHDCVLSVVNGARLTIARGCLLYKNVLSSSLIMENNLSNLYIASPARLALYESMIVNKGRIYFEDQARLAILEGKELNGSIVPLGTLYRQQIFADES